MLRVIGVGDNVVDLYINRGLMYPGGNALNFAVYASFLENVSAYLGVFGDDEAAIHVYQTAVKLGIDLTHSRFYEGENGCAKVILNDGDRVFIESNKGGVHKSYPLKFTKLDIEYIKSFDLMHTSIFSYIESQLPILHSFGVKISYDFSSRFTDDNLKNVCPYLWCACLSSAEKSAEENQSLIKKIVSYGCPFVIVTCGTQDALVWANGKLFRQTPCICTAKDTLGAGDSFITAFLVHYLIGIKKLKDFPARAKMSGVTKIDEYLHELVRISLYQAAIYSAEVCQIDGAFGHGKVVEK